MSCSIIEELLHAFLILSALLLLQWPASLKNLVDDLSKVQWHHLPFISYDGSLFASCCIFASWLAVAPAAVPLKNHTKQLCTHLTFVYSDAASQTAVCVWRVGDWPQTSPYCRGFMYSRMSGPLIRLAPVIHMLLPTGQTWRKLQCALLLHRLQLQLGSLLWLECLHQQQDQPQKGSLGQALGQEVLL